MRKSVVYLISISALTVLLTVLIASDQISKKKEYEARIKNSREVTKKLELTDICLFTEARYTRHLTQADLFSAYQDSPYSFDLFPSGSVVLPPDHLIGRR